MINGKPETRFELLDNLWERLQTAKAQGDEIMFVETWEMAWLLVPEKQQRVIDPDGTGKIAFDFEQPLTQRHKAIEVRNVEDYLVRVNCNDATQPYEKTGG